MLIEELTELASQKRDWPRNHHSSRKRSLPDDSSHPFPRKRAAAPLGFEHHVPRRDYDCWNYWICQTKKSKFGHAKENNSCKLLGRSASRDTSKRCAALLERGRRSKEVPNGGTAEDTYRGRQLAMNKECYLEAHRGKEHQKGQTGSRDLPYQL